MANGGTATPNPPFTIKDVIAHIEDKCIAFSYSMLRISAGQTFLCPAIVHFFDSNGNEYRIYMAPNWTQPATPETSYVQVTCNAVAGDHSGCNDWFIDPIPAGRDGNGNSIPGAATGRLVGPPLYRSQEYGQREPRGLLFPVPFPPDPALIVDVSI